MGTGDFSIIYLGNNFFIFLQSDFLKFVKNRKLTSAAKNLYREVFGYNFSINEGFIKIEVFHLG